MWRGLVIIVRLPFFLIGLIALTLLGPPLTVGHNIRDICAYAFVFRLRPFIQLVPQ
jgi:hypothetical protein